MPTSSSERWERAKDREIQAITDLARWLAERIPKPTDATPVHGDLKLDNVMLDATDPGRVVAVLDWEMCTTGDPLIDLGQLLCYWAETGDPYPKIAFYEIFAIYKTAVVIQQIYIRWKRGQTKDERFAGMAPRVEALAEAALTLAAKSGL